MKKSFSIALLKASDTDGTVTPLENEYNSVRSNGAQH